MTAKPVLAIVVGGGPAPGINTVISSATIAAYNLGWECIGIMDGFTHLIEGKTDRIVKLDIHNYGDKTIKVSRIHNRGGTVLRTARANPTKNPTHLNNCVEALKKLNVRYLISIGGDDTATSSAALADASKGAFTVCHVPKTIDNDLPLPPGISTFGYQTARHYGVEICKNLSNDAKSTVRWYIVVAMGRAAGHLALGIGKGAAATLTLIPEELKSAGGDINFSRISDIVEGCIIKRKAMGKDYGVIVLAEGLAEYLSEAEIMEAVGGASAAEYLRDEHGHLRLDEVDLGGIIKRELQNRFGTRKQKVTIIAKKLGYELRCADPIPFDVEYCRDLGFGAVDFLRDGGSKGMITSYNDKCNVIPFSDFMDKKTGRASTRVVDITGVAYQSARAFMIRLDKNDNNPEQIERLAKAAVMPVAEFKSKFDKLLMEEPPALRVKM